jgi:hypothetical protein
MLTVDVYRLTAMLPSLPPPSQPLLHHSKHFPTFLQTSALVTNQRIADPRCGRPDLTPSKLTGIFQPLGNCHFAKMSWQA